MDGATDGAWTIARPRARRLGNHARWRRRGRARRAIVPERDGETARERAWRPSEDEGGAGVRAGDGTGIRTAAAAAAKRSARAMRTRRMDAEAARRTVGMDDDARAVDEGSAWTIGGVDDADAEAAARGAHAEATRAGDLERAVRALAACARERESAGRPRAIVGPRLASTLASGHKGFVDACARQRRMDVALRYARLFDADKAASDGEPDLFCAVINACGRAKDWAVAREAFDLRRTEAGLAPDPFAYSALVSSAAKCGNYVAAREAFEEANAAHAVDTVVYNAFIDACASRGDYEGARATLERMKTTANVKPNIRSYNGVISASTRRKHFSGALAAWEELQLAKLAPTIITYGAMLAAGAATDDVDVAWSEELFADALQSGACGRAGNDHMVSSLISAYARGVVRKQIDKKTALERAEAIVRLLSEDAASDDRRAKASPNARVWCALITLCARCGQPGRAIEVLKIMNARGGASNAESDRYLMYAMTSALEASKEGDEHFGKMQRIISQSPTGVRESTGVRNALISTHLHFGDFKSAFALYAKFKSDVQSCRRETNARARRALESQLPDTITFNTLIHACASNGEDGKAMELYRDMLANGVPPSLRTYVSLIVSLSRSKRGSQVEEAERLFDVAIEDGVEPNEFLFTSLMDAQVKANRPFAAFDTYERMREADVSRTTVTYGCALQACYYVDDEEDGVERAYAILRDMTESGVQMNDWCSNTFLRVISRAGRIEEMLEEVKKIVRRKGMLEQETFEAIIRALCLEGYVGRANRFMSMMDSRGLVPSEHTFKEFIVACSRDGSVEIAWDSYKRFARLGYKLDVNTRSSLIVVLSVGSMSGFEGDENGEVLLARAIAVFEAAMKHENDDVIDDEARCALIVAMARNEKLESALAVWRESHGRALVVKSRRHTSNEGEDYIGEVRAMYESLIEVCCHQDRIDEALEVFDELKDAGVRVSTVTLAFLESSCRRSRVEEYRVFDVCAQMRAQVDQKRNGRLVKPTKTSHHVRADGVSDIAAELATDGLGGDVKKSTWRKPT
ncbi:Tetratricopeptide-like helical [Ostreococcus tauri]|uniref:Tetratricopeptide-like helical n=1 Tax=Ostreococcus tauri TaxID=70448 RepID=A0A096P8B6_OSTTA|nr:Tetratricopeptide-like helical [Ostreococcus tauri]CEG00208.1 Tetratricopeptide-like helical [Ostreococcus tauri]|eukprot:XP_022840251.1 Tetratricopeptide-like helical [Ostreococcus tauri]